jgi:hypothetical protein
LGGPTSTEGPPNAAGVSSCPDELLLSLPSGCSLRFA